MQNLSCVTGCMKALARGHAARETTHGTLANTVACKVSGNRGTLSLETPAMKALSGEFKCFKPTPFMSMTARMRSTTRPWRFVSSAMTTFVMYSMLRMWNNTTALMANPRRCCRASPSDQRARKASRSFEQYRVMSTGCPCRSVRCTLKGRAATYNSWNLAENGPSAPSRASTRSLARAATQRASQSIAPSAQSGPNLLSCRACHANRTSAEAGQFPMQTRSARAARSSLC
mmetsp:Transcript_12102/g.30110  ORF Transcript_12102/g.30110 Transcript_12102/m.30110 type:complete len:231 (-) Transcript_12102:176-868(-)